MQNYILNNKLFTKGYINSFISFFLFIFLVSTANFAQTYTMSNGGSASSCTGTFLDPGGTGNYSGGTSDWTYTICNPTPGQPIYLSFSMFDLWSNSCAWGASVDELFIYDGPNTGSPLIGTYSDNTSAPSNITGTSGCITVRFHREDLGGFLCSSNSGNPGWSAAISCTPPPPDGTGCFQSIPFCTALTYNFPNSTGTTAPSGPNYGCLLSEPNPTWYYMEVDQGGSFNIGLVQTTGPNGTGTGIDVDFALYGPFTSLSAGCTSIMGGGLAPIQCSYSTSYTETIGIGLPGGTGSGASTPPAAVAGQFYIVLLTNFNGSAGYMDFNQTGGTGVADCSIVTPCDITGLTATPGACNSSTNLYNLTGQVTFVTPPATGTLTVTNSCGGSQTFNAPFTSPTNYSIPSLTSNGAACTVTAAFSADPTCTLTQNYTAPASCLVGPCNMDSLHVSIGSCQAGSLFTISGNFWFQNAPATGTATVTVTNSGGTQTQTFNAPFVNGQAFSVANNAANGSTFTVTVQFSASAACNISLNGTSTASCNCSVDVGTQTVVTTGDGTMNYVLCFDDDITLTPNGDYTPPTQANSPPNPTGYSPGIGYFVYSCPPTVAVVPDLVLEPMDDPCFIGVYSVNSLYDWNDQYWMNAYPGVFANNTVYFVPITFYTTTSSPFTYTHTNTPLPCYEMGTPIAVQYLPEVTFTQTQACQLGTVTATINGGLPQINGSQFHVVPGSLTPATATFNNTTAANGGTITIGGLTNGNNYSFQVQDDNGCPITITGTFTGVTSSAFTYPSANYCKNGANPSPTVTGVTGGTFSAAPAGMVINAGTGVINLTTSTAGTYTVTYTSPGAPCNSQSTFVVTINPLPVVNVPPMAICVGGSTTLTATGASTYTWSPATGLSATTGTSVTATPAATQVYTIVGTITATGCQGTTTTTVTVNPLPTIAGTFNVCVGSTRQLTGSATANAVNPWQSSNTGIATISNTGLVTGVSAGITTITYTNSNGCVITQSFTVNALPTVVANNVSVCTTGTIAVTASGASTYSWSPATNLSASTGASVTFTPGTTTNYTVTGTDVNGCVNTDPVTVTVLANAPIVASADVTICNGAATNISAAGGVSYTWNQGLGAGQNFNVSPVTTTTYTVTGTDASGCVGSDQVIVTVVPNPTASIASSVSVCQNATAPTLTFTGANGTAPYTFTYTINGGANQTVVSVGNTATVSVPTSTVGAFTYALVSVAESANGCSQAQTQSATVTVNPLPTATIIGTTSVCRNATSPVVTFNGLSGTAPYTFTYNINGGGNTTVVSNGAGVATINAPTATAGTFTYNLVSVTDASTTSCSQAQPQSIVITVNPLPTATISGTAPICVGGASPTITFTGANGTAPYTFTYNINGAGQTTITSVGNTATILAPTGTAGTYNYNLVSVQDASTTACTQNQAGTATITVNPNPVPVITGQTEYCAGTTATISTSQAFSSYNWSPANQATQSIQVTDADNPITVTVTNAFGCVGTSAAFTVTENTVITTNTSVEICQGGSALIHGISRTTAGVYSQTFIQPTGCDSTSNVTLVVHALPVINAGIDQTVCDGVQVTLNATGAPTIAWSPVITNGVPFSQPVGTQTYTATGTDAFGCVNTDAVNVTVLPLPVMNSVSNQLICNNTSTTAVTFGSNPAGTYTWTNNNTSIGLAANGNGNIAAFNGINPGTILETATITVTPTAATCVGSPLQFTISVKPSPTAQIAGTNQVCLNGTSPVVTFTGNNGTSPYTFTYNINGGGNQTVQSVGNTATINAPTNVAGVFNYNLVSVQEASANACTQTQIGIATITVNALPNVNAGADQAVCIGEQVTLSASGATTFVWSPLVTNNVAFTPSLGSQVYTVTGTDANGCVNTDNATVLVNPLPVINAGPDQAICIGDGVTLTAQGGGVGTTYVWNAPITNGVEFFPNATASYNVVGTDANGCQNDDDVIVVVNSLPTINAGNNLTGCNGDDFVLTGSGAGPTGTYTWDNGVTNGVTFTPTVGTTTYTVTGTDANGCKNTDQTDIFIQDPPNVSFTYVQDGLCAPVTVTFTNTTTPAGVNCIWFLDDGSVINGCGPIVHVFDTPGIYGASLQTETAQNGCVGTVYYPAIVVVEANPIAAFSASPNVTTLIDTEIHFTNQSQGATSYVWNFSDDSATSTAVNPDHTFPDDEVANYNVMLIASTPAGCVDTAYQIIRIKDDLIYYIPNTFTPDQDQYNETFQPIFTSGFDPYDYMLQIYDRWGEIIFESHDATIGWGGMYGVDGNKCQDGTYTWKIEFKTTSSDERKVIIGHVNLLR